MKKLFAFAMILSLGMFCAVGCKPPAEADKAKPDDAAAAAPAEGDAAPAEGDAEAAKTEDAAPAEGDAAPAPAE